VKVLYVNHTSHMSGGEQSLLSTLSSLPAEVEPAVACPEGPLARAARELGVPVSSVPGTAGSLRLHPWHTPRAMVELAVEGWAVRRLVRASEVDLVHANSIRAGIAVCLALGDAAPPVLVHVRDCLPRSLATRVALAPVGRRATLVLANSGYTERCFLASVSGCATSVLHSPVDVGRFDPASLGREEARARLGVPGSAPLLAVVAQVTPWKGQADAIRIAAGLKDRFPDLRLLLVGSAKFVSQATRYDNLAYTWELERLIASLGLGDQVAFLGERQDVPEILRAVDVLLAPSWEEPFGRMVVEAMAMEVAVAAADEGGPVETVRDGVDGLLLAPRSPEAWVEPVASLLESPGRRQAMGRNGRVRVKDRFSTAVHAGKLVALYRDLAAGR